jgi:hypothetical protein
MEGKRMKLAELVKAAQEYDFKMRPKGKRWTKVPDSQVARLLTGAVLANRHEQRQVPLIPPDA